MKGVRKEIVDYWSKVDEGLSVADIKNRYIKENVAQLMENQVTQDIYSGALLEDFGIGVGAPTGADQGIPHGGDAKAVLFLWLSSAAFTRSCSLTFSLVFRRCRVRLAWHTL